MQLPPATSAAPAKPPSATIGGAEAGTGADDAPAAPPLQPASTAEQRPEDEHLPLRARPERDLQIVEPPPCQDQQHAPQDELEHAIAAQERRVQALRRMRALLRGEQGQHEE